MKIIILTLIPLFALASSDYLNTTQHNSIHGYNNRPAANMQKRIKMHRLHKIDEEEAIKKQRFYTEFIAIAGSSPEFRKLLYQNFGKSEVRPVKELLATIMKTLKNIVKMARLLLKQDENSGIVDNKEYQAMLKLINEARQEVFKTKEKLLADINQKGLAFYQKIRRWAKNTTVVTVEDQACMGCHMLINDKTYADVIKAEDITNCPHCGRILYMDTSSQE